MDKRLGQPATIQVFQALWAMTRLTTPEASLTAKFDQVRTAGFDGMAIDLGALSMAEAELTAPHFARTGLAAGVTAFPASDDDLQKAIALAQRLGAAFLVVIGQDMPVSLGAMIAVIERWLRIAERESMALQFETHRNCITNDLFTTVQLIAALPQLRLAADLSHYVVDREMPCPPTAALSAMISTVLAHSDSFQGRIAARGQIQIALNFPHNAKWVQLFRAWWLEGLTAWRQRHANADQGPVFLCELGPPDYALVDAEGREMTDRWEESLLLRDWARSLWRDSASRSGLISDAH